MTLTVVVFLVLGLVLLVAGAELLVRGAARLAARFGISPLVIGLTVVAFGTSSPELAVSVQSGLSGQADIAVGNIVGSNIFNVLVVLGLSALIAPLVVQQQLVRFDVPLVIGVSVLFWVMALDGRIGLFDGLLLTAGIVAYTVFAIRQSRQESPEIQAEYAQEPGGGASAWIDRLPVQIVFIAAGLVLLVLGATWLVDSAVAIAHALGVSEIVIGLTIVAVGTSLPELATSLVAALRGERDIAVGNVIGSSLFNLPVMIAVALACLPIFATGHRIARWEGALFLGYYAVYVSYLILAATQHMALPAYSATMLGFVLPLTVVTLIVLLARHRTLPTAAAP